MTPQEGIIFICCGNADGFHKPTNKYFLRYILVDGRFIDTPTYKVARWVLDHFDEDILVIIAPCNSCKSKGIKGPTGSDIVKRGGG